MTRTLYGYWRSSAAYRVRIALALKGLNYEQVNINLRAGEQRSSAYSRQNPQGLVPFFTDGDIRLSQSIAILELLDELYPEKPLLPADPVLRAYVRAASLAIACDIHPLNNLRVLNELRSQFGADDAAIERWTHRWIATGFDALEALATSDGPFLMSRAPTLADVCLVPQMYNARRVNFPVTSYKRLCLSEQQMLAIPAVREATPEMQPDAV